MAGGRKNLSALITFGGKVSSTFGRSTGRLQSGIDRVGDTIKKVTSRQAKLRREIRKGRKAGRDVASLERRYDELGRTVTQLTHKQRGLQIVQNGLRTAGRGVVGAFGAMRTAALAYAAGLAVVTATVGATMGHSVQWSVELERNAARLGTTTQGLQELRLAAAQLGIEADKVDDGLADLGERIAEAIAEPDGSIAETFQRIGLDAQRLRGLDITDQLGAVGDALRGLSDDEQRLFAARKLAGDEGADAILALTRQGAEGLRRLREEARRSVVPEESQAQLRSLGSAWTHVSARVEALVHTVAAELAPTFETWLIKLRKGLDAIDLEQVIAGARDAAKGLMVVGDAIADAFRPALEVAGQWTDTLGGWGPITAGVIGFILSPLILLGATVSGIATAFEWVANSIRVAGASFGAWSERMRRSVNSVFDRVRGVALGIQNAFTTAWTRVKVSALQTFAEVTARAAEVGATIDRIMGIAGGGGGGPSGETPSGPARAAVDSVRQANARGGNSTSVNNAQTVNVTVNGTNDPAEAARLAVRMIGREIQQQTAGALTGG